MLSFAVTERLRHVNQTYINLTQTSIARQVRLKIVSPARQIGFRSIMHISHIEIDLAMNWTLNTKALDGRQEIWSTYKMAMTKFVSRRCFFLALGSPPSIEYGRRAAVGSQYESGLPACCLSLQQSFESA